MTANQFEVQLKLCDFNVSTVKVLHRVQMKKKSMKLTSNHGVFQLALNIDEHVH